MRVERRAAGAAGRQRPHGLPGRARFFHPPLQDRHARAPRRPHHRLFPNGAAAGRRADHAVFVFDRRRDAEKPRPLLSDLHHEGDARNSPCQPAPRADVHRLHPRHGGALLSLHRGQSRALQGQGAPPRVSRTRRAVHHGMVRAGHVHLDAGGSAARLLPHRAGAGKRAPCAPCLRHRIRLHRSHRPHRGARLARDRGAVVRRAGERHLGLRGGRRAGRLRRHQRRALAFRARTHAALPRRRLSGRAGGRSGHQGRGRALPHDDLARRIPAGAAAGQRRFPPN